MERENTKFVKWECKEHGFTDFYTYRNGKRYKCVTCARKQSKKWKGENPERVIYTLNIWNKNNQEALEEYRKKHLEECRKKSKERRDKFYGRFGSFIDDVKSKIGLKKISRNIMVIKDPDEEKIFNFLIDLKRAELRMYHTYRISSYVKWEHLKALNLKSAAEEQKKIIREEYKAKAKEFVDLEIDKIIKNYKQNK